KVDVRNALPAFSPLDDLRLPANTAWMTVASVLIVLTSYLLMARRRGQGSGVRGQARRQALTPNPSPLTPTSGVAWLGCFALLGGGLNNGEAEKTLYVMRPDGQVVRQVLLAGKTDVAIGLDFAPDGKLYVSDMVGGAVLKYEPAGGSPIGATGGQTGGFNNVAGIA